MKGKIKLFGIVALVALIGFSMVACDSSSGDSGYRGVDGGGGTANITWNATPVGNPTTTAINFTFSANPTGLAATNITVTSGTGSATRGVLSGSGTTRTLTVLNVNAGTLLISINRDGISSATRSVTLITPGATHPPADGTGNITWNATPFGSPTTTAINFTFSANPVGLTASDITIISGTGSAMLGILTGAGTTRTLAVSSVNAGTLSISINRTGISSQAQLVMIIAPGTPAQPGDSGGDGTGGAPPGGGSGTPPGDGAGYNVWLPVKSTRYAVSDGVVGAVSGGSVTTWHRFAHRDGVTEYTVYRTDQINDVFSGQDTFSGQVWTTTQTGYRSTIQNVIVSGDTTVSTSNDTSDITVISVFGSNSSSTPSHSRNVQETTSTIERHSTSGLALRISTIGTSTSIQNGGTPISGLINSESNWTIEQLSTVGGVRTYRRSLIGGTSESVYRMLENRMQLEIRQYNAGELFSIQTFAPPDNSIIRERLPGTRVVSSRQIMGNQARTTIHTDEVLEYSSTVLVVRTRTHTDGVLVGQTDVWPLPR